MAEYLITFKPSGPYFFGNDKIFDFVRTNESPYYIVGEKMPMQSTLFGAMRYLLHPTKTFDMTDEVKETIGGASFNMDATQKQLFGKIESMSPIFLLKDEEWFIPTPFDHDKNNEKKVKDDNGKDVIYYTPLSSYGKFTTAAGEKLYSKTYDAKEGIEDSFMSLSDGHLETELFASSLRVGINRNERKGGFFKRDFKSLNSAFSFAVIATINDDLKLDKKQDVVMLGQCKVPFAVRFRKVNETYSDKVSGRLKALREGAMNSPENVPKRFIYCASEMLVVNPSKLYDDMSFAVVQTKGYRSFQTEDRKIVKGETFYRLVRAGSVFLPNTDEYILPEPDDQQKNAQMVGFNTCILI